MCSRRNGHDLCIPETDWPDYSACSRPPAALGLTIDSFDADAARSEAAASGFPAPPLDRDALAAISVSENDEPLVILDGRRHGIVAINAYRSVGWAGTRPEIRVRAGVLDRLSAATAALPTGFGLAVYDGWRSPATIRALYSHHYGPGSTLAPGFLADPDDESVIPPHLTGGAVDVTLTWFGRPLSLGTDFDDFTDAAAPSAPPSAVEEPGRSLRAVLAAALQRQGFIGEATEWWHFSVGDQAWALQTGAPCARYGPAYPPD